MDSDQYSQKKLKGIIKVLAQRLEDKPILSPDALKKALGREFQYHMQGHGCVDGKVVLRLRAAKK